MSNIILYGAGKAGVLVYEILKICGIEVRFFVDNDKAKNGTMIIDGIKCYLPELIYNKDLYDVCLCASNEKYIDVSEEEVKNGAHYNVTCVDEAKGHRRKCRIANDALELLENQARRDGFSRFFDFSSIIDDCILKDSICLERVLKLIYGYDYIDMFLPQNRLRTGNETIGRFDTESSNGEKIAVYTSIFGNYDSLLQPLFESDQLDFYFVGDEEPKEVGVFQWIDAKRVVPDEVAGAVKRNRYVKMHSHVLFPGYKYTIYLDGALQVCGDISGFIHKSRTGISAFEHYERDCLFYEALQIVNGKRVVPEDVYEHLSRYLGEGMPVHYGLTEMSVVACDHTVSDCDRILELWWEEFIRGAQRDQLSFMYVLWKNGYRISDVSSLGENFRECKKLKYFLHPKLSQMIDKSSKR